MTWEDLIIILVAVSLITVMRYLDTMPGYTCPAYCATAHKHFWIINPDSDQPVGILQKPVKSSTYVD